MEGTKKVGEEALINGFSPISSTPVFWKSRKRPAAAAVSGIKNLVELEATNNSSNDNNTTETEAMGKEATNNNGVIKEEINDQSNRKPIIILSEKRKALFEPLEPTTTTLNGLRSSNESLLPPPDFDLATYPKGWLVGKKRKLVNVDVVESMRRIAVQEMNRKDMEIDGLNEQLEEDARVLEHLQVQLVEERSKRGDVERQNAMLQNQITMLMDMLQYNDPVVDDDDEEGPEEP